MSLRKTYPPYTYQTYITGFSKTSHTTANAQNHNRYTYCLNNPLRYTDPSGYRFSFLESFNTCLDAPFYNLMLNDCLGDYLYDEDGGGSGSFTPSSGGYTDWVTGTTYTSTADMVSAAWNNTPDGSVMSYFFTDGQLDCSCPGFALPGAVIYGNWHMGIWRTSSTCVQKRYAETILPL